MPGRSSLNSETNGAAMRSLAAALAILPLAAVPALADDPVRPDPRITPGAVLTTDARIVCQPGYTKTVRHTSSSVKHRVYRDYGIDPRDGHYEIDHLVPLELGGADVRENLWPESYETAPWNARVKDQLENFLHAEVCAGRMSIEQAQRLIARDWITAYQQLLGQPQALPSQGRRRRG